MVRTFLRMDDIGASTKVFEVYSRLPLGNVLFLKYVPPFRAWGPYRELTSGEWNRMLELLRQFHAHLTVGITAAWVEQSGQVTPFPQKFPHQAAIVRDGVREGLLEIANHGLTHCVVGRHLPRTWKSNRQFHREFWDWIPPETHREHVRESQRILRAYFGVPIITFIPPGNVWTEETERAAASEGLRLLASKSQRAPTGKQRNGLTYLGDDDGMVFHDREVVQGGIKWFARMLQRATKDKQLLTVCEYMEGYGH